MNLIDMRPQPEFKSNISKADFFDWKEAGTMGSKVRPFGGWIRRHLHFVRLTKVNGEEITVVVPCINFDYEQQVIVLFDEKTCPLDEVYEAQLKGEKTKDLPFIHYADPPSSWGKDAKITVTNFSATVNAINRAKQNGSGTTEECLQVVSFKKTAFDRVLLLAGAVDSPDADFTRGDPAQPDNGFDLKLAYHADKPGINRYEVQAGLKESPLTDEEKEVVSDCMDLGEYYKVRTRDGIIEHLTKIHESDSNGNGSSSSGDVTDEIAGMMNKAESSLNFA